MDRSGGEPGTSVGRSRISQPRRAALASVCLGAAMLAAAASQAQEPVRVRVDYTFEAIFPSGNSNRVEWTVGAVLSGGNRVQDSFEGRSGSGQRRGGSEGALGGRWRVLGPNELLRTTEWPNSQTLVRVTVEGKTCRAAVSARLKPGKSVYLVRRLAVDELVEIRNPTYSNVRCSIE